MLFHHTGKMFSRLGRSTNALRVARVDVPTTGSCRCVEFQSRTKSREALDGKMEPPLGFAPSSSRYQRDASLSRLRRHGPGGRNCTSVVPKDGWVTANCDCCSATPGKGNGGTGRICAGDLRLMRATFYMLNYRAMVGRLGNAPSSSG